MEYLKEFQAFAGRFSAAAEDKLARVDGGTYNEFFRFYSQLWPTEVSLHTHYAQRCLQCSCSAAWSFLLFGTSTSNWSGWSVEVFYSYSYLGTVVPYTQTDLPDLPVPGESLRATDSSTQQYNRIQNSTLSYLAEVLNPQFYGL